MLDNELVRRTDAWKEGHVVYLEPANWYLTGGGIQAIRQNVAQLSEAFTEAE
jgi:iron complex transport system substrate-binding protein